MNIAVCDDNAADARLIRDYLLEHFDKQGFTGEIHLFDSGEALLGAFSPCFFDAFFLDIYMPGCTGVEAARVIRRENPCCALVFITVSPDHMREAYALRANSYVEKPITPSQMDTAFTQCRGVFLKNARYIEINCDRRPLRIPLIKIQQVELDCRATLFHLTTGEVFKTYITLDEVENKLDSEAFLRCHRSFLVNLNHVTDILDTDLQMRNSDRVPLRKNGRKAVCAAVYDFLTRQLFETE